jgi:hypothetical protein
LIGFAGALRRSELVALNIEDIEEAPDGMKITIRLGEAETVKFQVADQRRMAGSHEEVGVQVEAIARQSRLFRGATATDVGVSFDDRDFQTGSCQIGRKRQSVVSGSDDNAIEFLHSLLSITASTR